MLRSRIRAFIGPRLTRLALRLLHGTSLNEVYIVEDAFSSLGHTGVMVDVGAHHGGSLHGFAAAGWQVFAFEPDPANRAYLTTLTSRMPNVRVDTRGVSDTPKKDVAFFTSAVSTGISGLSQFHPSHRESHRVDLTTLSDFLTETHIDEVDFLKIDTEGFDLFVLKGFPWERITPQCIVCEYENRKTKPLGYETADMFNYLKDRGYEITISEWHPIREYGTQHQWKAFRRSPTELDPAGCGNFIACKPGTPVANALNFEALNARYAKLAG